MIKLQSGISRPSSATEVAKIQFKVPFLKLIIVLICSRNEVSQDPSTATQPSALEGCDSW